MSEMRLKPTPAIDKLRMARAMLVQSVSLAELAETQARVPFTSSLAEQNALLASVMQLKAHLHLGGSIAIPISVGGRNTLAVISVQTLKKE